MSDFELFDESEKEIKYEHSIVGTKGKFWSVSGQVEYILTSAKLSIEEYGSSAKLTRQLYPVREMLDFSKLDFDQLLQRDLDDHRVATDLIPYLLKNTQSGPSFFPPIVAALLPFRNKTPIGNFPEESEVKVHKDDGAYWKGQRFGRAYQVVDLVSKSGNEAPFKMSKLAWNEGGARLVVLDGQHRAMAMLAIARTITDTWGDSAGEKYKYFYESKVKKLIEELGGEEWLESNIERIEFPVCIVRFNDLNKGGDHHEAARKLFIDVNQNARRPSQSRLILLSDNDLLNIFTRNVLNDIRKPENSFPIYAMEYDYPGSSKGSIDSTKPIKWSAAINIEMLRAAVLRTVFGPQKYIENLNVKPTGKPNWTDKNSYMARTLELGKWFPNEVEYENEIYSRDGIKRDYFPKSHLPQLIEKFKDGWGDSIIQVLNELLPYSAHAKALEGLLDDWSTVEDHASLAKEAISKGQGLYWTLKDSYEHWRENDSGKTNPDTNVAWIAINKKKDDFYSRLSQEYLNNNSSKDIESTKEFFTTFNTYASFVGLFTTLSTLVYKHGIKGKEITSLTSEFISAINFGLSSQLNKRKLFLSRGDNSINMISSMDAPDSVYFRYFWLELLSYSLSEEKKEIISEKIVNECVSEAREFYLKYLIQQEVKRVKSGLSNSEWEAGHEQYKSKAEIKAKDDLWKALKKNFSMKKSDFEDWVNSIETISKSNEQDEQDEQDEQNS